LNGGFAPYQFLAGKWGYNHGRKYACNFFDSSPGPDEVRKSKELIGMIGEAGALI
jgi:hypothetical protein